MTVAYKVSRLLEFQRTPGDVEFILRHGVLTAFPDVLNALGKVHTCTGVDCALCGGLCAPKVPEGLPARDKWPAHYNHRQLLLFNWLTSTPRTPEEYNAVPPKLRVQFAVLGWAERTPTEVEVTFEGQCRHLRLVEMLGEGFVPHVKP